MMLIEQIIQKKIELSNEQFLNKDYKRAIWNYYCAYNLAIAVINNNLEENKNSMNENQIKILNSFIETQDKNKRIMNKLWSKFLRSDFGEKKFKILKRFMKDDFTAVIQSIRLINEESEKLGFDMGSIDRPSAIGILAFEFPE